jgi:hypothetical protein
MDELVDYLEVITYQLDDFRKSETNHKEWDFNKGTDLGRWFCHY